MKRVGQILAEARKNKGLTLDQIEEATKIRKNVLASLEEGDWSELPSPTFVKGLLKNYGSFLGLNPEDLLAFYRREFDERKTKQTQKPIISTSKRFRLTPKWVTGFVAACAIVGVAIYLFVQYRSFTGTPLLELSQPEDNIKIESNQVSVVGRTWPDAVLKINGQEVQLSPGGSFSVAVSLPEGVNTITVTAANRFGKIATQKRTLVVDLPQTDSPPFQGNGVSLDLQIGPSSAGISVEVDGKVAFEGVLSSGAKRNFSAKERIRLITRNAGSTKIKYKEVESILGKEGETIERVFTK